MSQKKYNKGEWQPLKEMTVDSDWSYFWTFVKDSNLGVGILHESYYWEVFFVDNTTHRMWKSVPLTFEQALLYTRLTKNYINYIDKITSISVAEFENKIPIFSDGYSFVLLEVPWNEELCI